MSPRGRRGRQAKNTPKCHFLRTLNSNLLWFMWIINFSLQAVENYDSCGSDGDENQSEKSEQEPDSLATHLVAWLGDAEGSKEGGRQGLKESHVLMVLGCIRRRRNFGGCAPIGHSVRIPGGGGTSNESCCGLLQPALAIRLKNKVCLDVRFRRT